LAPLDVIFWGAIILCLMGQILNSLRIKWCWPLWMIGGAILCYQLYLDQIWQQVILQIVYWFMNIVGWYSWSRKERAEKSNKDA